MAGPICFRPFYNISMRVTNCEILTKFGTSRIVSVNPRVSRVLTHRYRQISTSAKVSNFLQSRVSFTIATGLWVGVCGSLLVYMFKRNKQKSKNVGGSTGPGADERRHTVSRFSDKVVVITGAAGDIGGTTATAFAREGATLVLVDLPQLENVLKEKSKILKSEGASSVLHVTADVTKQEDVQRMVEYTIQKTGKINCLFNNAGIQGELRPLYEQMDEVFQRVININVFGAFLVMKYISKAMMETGQKGVIVNTSSLAGLVGPGNMAAYAASKFAVVGMTKTAAKDLAPYGIRVCAVAPGILEGKMWGTQINGNAECRKHLLGDESPVTEEEIHQQEQRMINDTPLRRLGRLSEVASVVLFLCSDEASYLTGVTLPIDGGKLR